MKIPPGSTQHEMANSTVWIAPDGLVYSIAKNINQTATVEEIEASMQEWRAVFGNKKVCLITESNNVVPPPKEQRDLIAQEIESICKGIAIITSSPMSRMIANLFFGLKPPSYPARMFKDQQSAEEWIRQYL